MMVDAEKTQRLLGVLRDALADLDRYRATVSRASLKSDRDKQHMVLHALYVAAQVAVDLALHLGADGGLPQPATYQDAFKNLAAAQALDAGLAQRLAGWAGFRNVLAHLYATVDLDRVYDALAEIEDLRAFAAFVSARLASE